VTISAARASDLGEIKKLLTAAGLPVAGVDDHRKTFIVARDNGVLVGCGGCEAYENAALIRSIAVDPERRTQLLRHLIQLHSWERTLVFVATKYAAEHIALKLQRVGLTARALHGALSQGARTQALADFKAGSLQVLIATDVAARGIDVTDLPAVINFDLPRSTDDYVHRIGRTGRAGASGVAVSFVSAASEAHFRLIEKRNRFRLERERLPEFEPTATTPLPPRPGAGGVKGTRKSKKDRLREAASRGALAEPAASAAAPPPGPWRKQR